jgi:hypothetical protein
MLSVIMLSVVMLSTVILSGVWLSAVRLTVMAPRCSLLTLIAFYIKLYITFINHEIILRKKNIFDNK